MLMHNVLICYFFKTFFRQMIPVWWRWYYWGCPVSWTLYGLIASQFGDITKIMESENESVQEFIRSYFGMKHDFIGVCAVVVVGTAVLFACIFAVSIKVFNFQRRQIRLYRPTLVDFFQFFVLYLNVTCIYIHAICCQKTQISCSSSLELLL